MSNYPWQIGTTYLFNLPPSWLIIGTVDVIHDDVLVLKHGVYMEALKSGASFAQYATAKTVAELAKVSERHWPLPDGYVLSRGFLAQWVPCAMSYERVAKAGITATIKKA